MKWNDWLAYVHVKETKEQDSVSAQPGTQGEPTEETSSPKFSRPMGRDRAKKQRTTCSSSSSTAYLELLQQMQIERAKHEERVEAATIVESKEIASRSERKLALQEQTVQIQLKQVEIQQELMLMQKEDREERVMSMDLERVSPWVRDYYIRKQKKIAAQTVSGDSSTPSSNAM